MPTDLNHWRSKLEELEALSRRREKLVLDSAQQSVVSVDGRRFLNFASNDYLGLANDSRVIEAGQRAMSSYGVGSGASHMVIGHHREHEALENQLAEFTGRDKALLFSTGYMANLAVCAAFTNSKSLILQDKLNHASLIDGAMLSRARSQRFLHNDPESLVKQLERFTERDHYENILIITDGVFSMDGDIAKLDALAKIAGQYDAMLAVDDAHGLGVLGQHGGGSTEHCGLDQSQCDLLIGTFGKAFGTSGAFVAGPRPLIDYLEQFARPHIYTTALPPAIAAATSFSLSIIQSEPERRTRLIDNIDYFRDAVELLGLDLLDSKTAIQGIVVGSNAAVLKVGAFLREKGCLTGVIRPPTVPEGSARLRITITSEHTRADLDALIALIGEARSEGLFSENCFVEGQSDA